jgi:hypothetical protein
MWMCRRFKSQLATDDSDTIIMGRCSAPMHHTKQRVTLVTGECLPLFPRVPGLPGSYDTIIRTSNQNDVLQLQKILLVVFRESLQLRKELAVFPVLVHVMGICK